MADVGDAHQFSIEALVAVLSTHFINCPLSQIDQGIDNALAQLGRTTQVDRTYLILLLEDGLTLRNTHEWCAPGIAPQIDELQDLPLSELPWTTSTIFHDREMHLSKLDDLALEYADERELFASGGIQSLLCVPLKSEGKILGLCGLDSVRTEKSWSQEEVEILRVTGEMFASVLARKQLEEKRSRLEAQLSVSQTMQAVERLAGGVAHDFNNLLTVILGNAHIAERILPEGETEIAHSLDEIIEAAERASELSGQLLAIGRRHDIERVQLSLNQELERMEAMIRRLLREDIELEVQLADSVPPVLADANEVARLILNLVANASEAMAQGGGKLSISTGQVGLEGERAEVLGAPPGDYVCLEVRDTGHGIAPEHLNHVFEPFFTTRDGRQTIGLGLSSVYSSVRQHGGFLEVQSEPGKGSQFRVYLCPSPVQQSTPAVPDAPSGPDQDEEVWLLVAEDDKTVRVMLTRVLERAGYQVLAAGDGVEALDVLEGHPGPVHLLLSDVVMPRMGGAELARQVRALRPEIPVLFISGYTGEVDCDDLRELGAFMSKPFRPRALLEAIEGLLRKVN